MSLLIRKKYIEKILKYQNTGSIIALTGVRYSGKSTVLKQTYNELKKRNIPKKNIKFIDFRTWGYNLDDNWECLSNCIDSLSLDVKGSKYLFIDNIEFVENWGRILNRCKYKYDLNIYIAPVNSNYLTNKNIREITYLHKIEIFPFSFKEFLEYYELNYNNKFKTLSEIELFEEYQKYGGLPEVLESEDIKYKYQIIKWSYQDTLNQNI